MMTMAVRRPTCRRMGQSARLTGFQKPPGRTPTVLRRRYQIERPSTNWICSTLETSERCSARCGLCLALNPPNKTTISSVNDWRCISIEQRGEQLKFGRNDCRLIAKQTVISDKETAWKGKTQSGIATMAHVTRNSPLTSNVVRTQASVAI